MSDDDVAITVTTDEDIRTSRPILQLFVDGDNDTATAATTTVSARKPTETDLVKRGPASPAGPLSFDLDANVALEGSGGGNGSSPR